jgi:hypothetical protein
MQLYNTKVIPAGEDKLWGTPADLPALAGTKLLVISAPFVADSSESQTLAKMMSACRLSATDYALIQLPETERLSWRALMEAGAPQRVLMLGISPAQLGISAFFQLNHCNNFLACVFIPGLSLGQLEQQPAAKRELWEQGLKPCFGI